MLQAGPEGNLAETVQAALADVMLLLLARGLLPPADYPAVRVGVPSAKQRKALPPECVLTSPIPLALAAAARRAAVGSGGSAQLDADEVANRLAHALSDGPAQLSTRPGCADVRVEALRGHLNFVRTAKDHAGPPVYLSLPHTRPCDERRGPVPPTRPSAASPDKSALSSKGALGARCDSFSVEVRCSVDPPTDPSDLQPQHDVAMPEARSPPLRTAVPAGSACWRVGETLMLSRAEAGPSSRAAGGAPRLEVVTIPMPATPGLVALEFPLFYKYETIQHHVAPRKVGAYLDFHISGMRAMRKSRGAPSVVAACQFEADRRRKEGG